MTARASWRCSATLLVFVAVVVLAPADENQPDTAGDFDEHDKGENGRAACLQLLDYC